MNGNYYELKIQKQNDITNLIINRKTPKSNIWKIKKKLITATIMQLKFGHDDFNSYLKNLTNYSKISKCYKQCHGVQNPNHLLINCNYFWNQQAVLIKNMKSYTQLIKALFTTTKKLKHLINFWNQQMWSRDNEFWEKLIKM